MEKSEFYKLARQPLLLNQDTLKELKKLTEDFPNFHAAWMIYLKNLKVVNDPGFDAVLKKAAPLLPDRKQLYRYLHSKAAQAKPDLYLESAGIPVQEYALEKLESSTPSNKLIDKFLSSASGALKLDKPPAADKPLSPENEIVAKSIADTDELVTETLANIYTEQKKYDKALEAFKKLSLKYPEKNSYFATRIEEIEKLKNI